MLDSVQCLSQWQHGRCTLPHAGIHRCWNCSAHIGSWFQDPCTFIIVNIITSLEYHSMVTPLPTCIHIHIVLHPGTRCLTISRTLIFPFKPSNVILRHSSFPHTSTFSTFEVSYKNKLYKFTVIIIIIIIIITESPIPGDSTNITSRMLIHQASNYIHPHN